MSALGVYLVSSPRPPSRVDERAWRGVFVGDDETEEDIATWLAARVLDAAGDLQRVVEALVPFGFPGWEQLLGRSALEAHDAVLVGPAALDETTFVYVFDVAERRLDVFATHSDASGERIGSLRFDKAGRVDPWEFVGPAPPRLASPLWPGWQGSRPFADATSRAELRETLTAALRERELDPESSLSRLAGRLAGAWRAACGDSARVLLPPDVTSGFWDVRLPDLEVWYPVPGHRHVVSASRGELQLFAAGAARPTSVPANFSALADLLGDGSGVVDALREASTETTWPLDVLDLLRGAQVPEEPITP